MFVGLERERKGCDTASRFGRRVAVCGRSCLFFFFSCEQKQLKTKRKTDVYVSELP